jgi:DNA replication protein DnaC
LPDSALLPKFECELCNDSPSGKVIALEEHGGKIYRVAKDCICRLEKVRRFRLNKIPPVYAAVANISTLQPNPQRHNRQAEIIKELKRNPDRNYFFGGTSGCGKSLFLWSLYREQVMKDRRVIACTLTELLEEYKTFIATSMNKSDKAIYPRISASELRQNHTKYRIFLDDIDKARPTEYAAEQLFDLANAIHDYQHQIVITTNLSVTNLVTHFERADQRFGGAIVRRLIESSKIYELF